MRRIAICFLALSLVAVFPGLAAADHPAPQIPPLEGPLTTEFNQGGIEGAEFSIIKSIVTGNPHTDLEFFSRGGTTYASVGTLGIGPNNAGQNIIKLTDGDAVGPDTVSYVSGHPSATCVTDESRALGLQHDVESTPKGADVPILTNLTDMEQAQTGDTQLLIDATDAQGRCHDQGPLAGFSQAPQGGLEIIDVTDPENPVEIGLTSHIGQAHTVNVDPTRPNIAYVVTSDSVSVNSEGQRVNETTDQFNHDGFEIVDLSSCMTAPFGTMEEGLDTAGKREACQPEVWRYRYPYVEMALGHTNQNAIYGCHELEVWPEDKITCGGGAAMVALDMSNVFARGPGGFDRPKGEPLPCRVRPSSSNITTTGAMVTDCVVGDGEVDLRIKNWLAMGEPGSITEDVGYLGTAHHQGRQATGGDIISPAYDSTEDIDFDHEAEFTHSRKNVISTDERGGGVLPPGAACTDAETIDNPVGNGGLHAYNVGRLSQTGPGDTVPTPEQAQQSYALTPEGDKAIFRAPINTQPQPTECTAHVFQQMPPEGDGTMGRIFMAWYTQGTQVVDYRENPDGTFEFAHVGYFIPELANTWVSHVFGCGVEDDGRITYYGATGDFSIVNGRNAIDIYAATLPPLGAAFGEDAAVTEPPEYCTLAFAPGEEDPGPTEDPTDPGDDGVGDDDDDRTGDDGVGDDDDNRTLPATGGGFGLIPAALGLLGAAAWLGRSRRNRDEAPPVDS